MRIQHRKCVVYARLSKGVGLLPRVRAVRVARSCGREEHDPGQADRQHEHGEHREHERDALLVAQQPAPGRAETAIGLSLREHLTRVVYGGVSPTYQSG